MWLWLGNNVPVLWTIEVSGPAADHMDILEVFVVSASLDYKDLCARLICESSSDYTAGRAASYEAISTNLLPPSYRACAIPATM
jgi:hypothetical protein